MSAILITGVAGFIGFNVAQQLLDTGWTVHGIDNIADNYNPCLKIKRLEILKSRYRFTFLECDIENAKQLDQAFIDKSVSSVIHLAARAGVRASVSNPRAYWETNLMGSLNVLEACRRFRIGKLVFASSSSVYGDSNTFPVREDYDTSHPLSPYAASKKAAEELCFNYHNLYQLDVSILRFFTVFGPYGRPDMGVFRFIRGIAEGEGITTFGDGRQIRDFSYVDDIARGCIAALRQVGFRAFNLGASHPAEVNSVIEIIERLTGKKAIVQKVAADPADVRVTHADVSRARTELNWEPLTSLELGLSRSVDWYSANREWLHAI